MKKLTLKQKRRNRRRSQRAARQQAEINRFPYKAAGRKDEMIVRKATAGTETATSTAHFYRPAEGSLPPVQTHMNWQPIICAALLVASAAVVVTGIWALISWLTG